MRRGLTVAALAATAIACCAALVSVSAGGALESRTYENERFGYSVSLPPGWHRAEKRLVPKLILPREILSVGTASMPVGQGGNCGREPIASIRRLRRGDALISIQEYAVTGRMRSRVGTDEAPPPRIASIRELRPRSDLRWPREKLWSQTLPFTDHGRWFDALVYVRGIPTQTQMNEVREILESLRFEAGGFVGLGI